MATPVLQIIVASTRPGRVGLPVAQWVRKAAEKHGGFTVELVDLAELNLPFMDEPNHPRLKQYVHEHTKRWSAQVDRADAFVFVMPEYNHGYTAPLKNAIDFLAQEWANKPVGIVSYGGVSAGTRAVTTLDPVLNAVRLRPAAAAVHIPFVAQFLSEERVIEPSEVMSASAEALLVELEVLARSCRQLRTKPAQS
ncbi:NAD(P)H-dependent oxidoreductase [Kineosporia sp. J2-2]|uniref:NAD(P)H-dependent oxidoreductase n=1 Tax=Kineosporia corallincola TaxID=2835133 RepID=A0ABS5TSQ9_9ACTN|nr:NAD(P)H-dependent oxidoreductase [Kineosporia corallincola]MBT0773799.1 NAD(P)H-dependent oxidoreductase [Kineosporia corallincola]